MKDTRERIIMAAASVWAEDRNAPLKLVAKKADISRMTLHRYFCGREMILQAILEQFFAGTIQIFCRYQNEPLADISLMRHLFLDMSRLGDEYIFLFAMFEEDGKSEQACGQFDNWGVLFKAFFSRFEETGLVKENVNSDWASVLFRGVMKSGFYLQQSEVSTIPEIEELMWDAYRNALFTKDAIEAESAEGE